MDSVLTLLFSVNSQKEGSDTLSPEAVQLFSSVTSFQPKIFAQLQVSPVLRVLQLLCKTSCLIQTVPAELTRIITVSLYSTHLMLEIALADFGKFINS